MHIFPFSFAHEKLPGVVCLSLRILESSAHLPCRIFSNTFLYTLTVFEPVLSFQKCEYSLLGSFFTSVLGIVSPLSQASPCSMNLNVVEIFLWQNSSILIFSTNAFVMHKILSQSIDNNITLPLIGFYNILYHCWNILTRKLIVFTSTYYL